MNSDYEAQQTESGEPVKPFISLSGDDDGKHYILYPTSEDKDEKYLLVETGDCNYIGLILGL